MNDKPIAIVLGGTNPHVELVKKLKSRGYYVMLIDYLPNPPAKSVADEHIQESTMDKDKVLEIARKSKAELVITTNIDQANVTACYVAEKLGLPHSYSYETALNVTDKARMKKLMWENGISTSKYVVAERLEDVIHHEMSYPLVIKPADSNGSRGVHRIDNWEELKHYFPDTKSMSRTNKVIIEEFIEGIEVSFYYYIQKSKAHYITSNQRFKFHIGVKGVMQSAGGLYPAHVSDEVYTKMQEIADKIATAFQLYNTPIFIQAIVRQNDVFILEFAPRIGGGLSFRLIETDNCFDILGAAIASFLGIQVELTMIKPDYYSAVMNIYAPGITVGEIAGLNKVIEKELALEFHQYKMEGAETSDDMSSGSRVGAFFVRGKNFDEVQHKIKAINELVEVFDVKGKEVMEHSIYRF